MDNTELYKTAVIDALADRDIIYQNQMRKLVTLEKQFDKVVGKLPDQDRALIWDYVMLCEDMSQRKQQLASKHMVLMESEAEQLALSGDWKKAAEKAAMEIIKRKENK